MDTSQVSSLSSAANVSQRSTTSRDVLSVTLRNARTIYNLLKATGFKEKAKALFMLTSNGIKVSVEDSKSMQAHAYIQKPLFDKFDYQLTEDVVFGAPLAVLLDCLAIYPSSTQVIPGVATTLRMTWAGHGHELHLLMEEKGVLTTCKLRTFEPPSLLEMNIRDARIVNKIIMKSEWLREAFDELDKTTESVTILVSPDHPFLRISAVGLTGSTELDYPRDADIIDSFQCEQTQINSYRLTMVQACAYALGVSTKTSLRTNEHGFLSLQFMIPVEDGQLSFVEFLMAPLDVADSSGY